MQVVRVEFVEYCPAVHSVHILAPASVPLLVIQPARQLVHEGCFGVVANLPASHLVHDSAPLAFSVIEPGRHSKQNG